MKRTILVFDAICVGISLEIFVVRKIGPFAQFTFARSVVWMSRSVSWLLSAHNGLFFFNNIELTALATFDALLEAAAISWTLVGAVLVVVNIFDFFKCKEWIILSRTLIILILFFVQIWNRPHLN